MSTNPSEKLAETVRPTKKQREILTYIEHFIGQHGYSPSYREIMNGLQYTSVATVSLHVNSLIRRGHLRKRDRSARSLEVVGAVPADQSTAGNPDAPAAQPSHEKWLVEKVESMLIQLESGASDRLTELAADAAVLIAALRVLGVQAAAGFAPRLAEVQVEIETPDLNQQSGEPEGA